MSPAREITVAIGGLGAIGLPVAKALDDGIPGLRLVAASASDLARGAERLAELKSPVPVVPLAELSNLAEVVVEAVPAARFDAIAEPAIEAGRTLLVLSCGVLLAREALIARAAETGARIIVPTGALLGLDAVRAAAEGRIKSVRMVSSKLPRGFAGAPYVIENGIDLDAITEPTKIFAGKARDAAKGFPANINVAAALSLAGIGPDRTEVEIWADPTVARNTHRIEVEAEETRFSLAIESVPSPSNPATGQLTPLSVIATLRDLAAPMRVGT